MSTAPVITTASPPKIASFETIDAAIPDDSILIKTRQGQHTVLQRLVGLFPAGSAPSSATPPSSNSRSTNGTASSGESQGPRAGVRWDESVPVSPSRKGTATNVKALKVRMVTWNMHDSLPKGELEELLGKVPAYAKPTSPHGTFPSLSAEADHPYHFVVVAGQECPSSSGIPMALGAGIKQLIERDKEKDKDRLDKLSPKDTTDKKIEADAITAHLNHLREQEQEIEEAIIRSKKGNHETPDAPPVGWTSIVSDWLCNGGNFGLVRSKSNKLTSALDVSSPKTPTKRVTSLKEQSKKLGPYQLLVKERLLGIYLAIYIHRDLKPLVKGVSKSAVTAGLIGGRVGNKGGVGISINLDGTTLLFLNAHLAAHEGRVSHRLSNLEKIKTELEVDDFLPDDHPRKHAEDLTDRFDFTFLCGDLNFRLDITRLHADWLIAQQDYVQALTFDQLLKLMNAGAKELIGFKEAPINFAPTFKYDVLRTLKRPKVLEDDNEEYDPEGEAMSISSLSTSYTRATELDLNNTTALPSPTTPIPTSASKLSLGHVVSANKAKLKLLSLGSPLFKLPKRKATLENAEVYPATPTSAIDPTFSPTLLTQRSSEPINAIEAGDSSPYLAPPPKIRVESMASNMTSQSQEDASGVEKGVYDSSHKKRVPSWCDRILWKTTIEPTPSPVVSPEPSDPALPNPPLRYTKRKFGYFLSPFRSKAAKSAQEVPVPSATKIGNDSIPPYLPPLKTAPPLSQTMFPSHMSPAESPSSTVDDHTPHPAPPVSASEARGRPIRQSITGTMPPTSAPATRRSAFGVLMSPLSGGDSATPSRWRFLPSFLSPSHGQTIEIEEPVTSPAQPPVVHRRGDVVCLDYNTLDDRGMRRLEGRSDHRPVLGTFVIYV